MIEFDLVLKASKLHNIKTRGMAIDLLPMARKLKKLDRLVKLAGLVEPKKKAKK